MAGRTFIDADDERAPKVVVVTDALARDLFGATGSVGRRVRFGSQGRDRVRDCGSRVGPTLRYPAAAGNARLLRASRAGTSSRYADARRQNSIGGCGCGNPRCTAPLSGARSQLPIFNIRSAGTARSSVRAGTTRDPLVHGVWWNFAAPGGHRIVWGDRVRCRSAHPRDRRSARDRCRARFARPHDHDRLTPPRSDRRGPWAAARLRGHAASLPMRCTCAPTMPSSFWDCPGDGSSSVGWPAGCPRDGRSRVDPVSVLRAQ